MTIHTVNETDMRKTEPLIAGKQSEQSYPHMPPYHRWFLLLGFLKAEQNMARNCL